MRKSIIMAVAAGALAVGGAASAQDLGSVLGSIFGYGNAYPGYGTSQSTPAVVAGTVPYYGNQTPYGTPQYGSTVPYGTTVYQDQYGRRFYYDQYGRQVMLDQPTTQQQYGIVGYDAWGRPVYGTTSTTTYGTYGTYGSNGNSAYATRNDRDGDGVVNWNDRYPDDPRYR